MRLSMPVLLSGLIASEVIFDEFYIEPLTSNVPYIPSIDCGRFYFLTLITRYMNRPEHHRRM